MEGLIAIIAILMVFGPPAYLVKRIFDLKEKRLDTADKPAELESLREERRLLQDRVENLEAIVCDVDFELNRRIAALSDHPALLVEGARPAAADAEAPEVSESRTENQGERAPEPSLRGATLTLDRGQVRAPATGELAPGDDVAGRYRVERLLGRGGMGAVYLARDEVLGEDVALKVISSAWAIDDREALDRLRREVSAARRIVSPHVIRIHDLGESSGVLYISMEYVAGRTLAEEIVARGTLDSSDGRRLLAQVCAGLGAAHDAGVVHRDLKPQNVLVGDDGAVKIIDFGLAKAAFMARMTTTGVLVGTPHYMSPEQVRGGEVDARADIYALGAVTYHAVTGSPPFDGPNPIAIGFAHCHEEPVPPRRLRPQLSRELDTMICKALSKAPEARPQTAAAFGRVLK